jgi:ComF family protein
MRHKIISISQRLRLPSICALCSQYHKDGMAVCFSCLQLFPSIGPACYYCALPLPDNDFLMCGHCAEKKPSFDHAIAPFHFEEPLRTLLHEFKYHEGLYLSSFFATLIKRAIPTESLKTQCLLPVPMHPKRLRQRGFNQAAELVKQLGRLLTIPYDLSHCKKIINTAPQAGLNAKQRQRNLKHAFYVDPLPYQHVTLVDDLLTTGSTANELANTLKSQGVCRVDIWCCARTVSV